MYGIVNKAIQDLIIATHGEERWETVKSEAEVREAIFVNAQPYDDHITYQLVAAASRVLKTPIEDIMIEFGRYWVTYTAQEGFEGLLKLGGSDLVTFLKNLDKMHAGMSQFYPEVRTPFFTCIEKDEGVVWLEYRSVRSGLAPFVKGLLYGLGERFKLKLEVQQVGFKGEADCDTFEIRYSPI